RTVGRLVRLVADHDDGTLDAGVQMEDRRRTLAAQRDPVATDGDEATEPELAGGEADPRRALAARQSVDGSLHVVAGRQADGASRSDGAARNGAEHEHEEGDDRRRPIGAHCRRVPASRAAMTAPSSSAVRTGFATCAWKPADNACSRSTGDEYA